MKLSVRTKLLGGFVVVLVLMSVTLAVDMIAGGNQAAIADRIVNHLDPARIAAAKIVTLVHSTDDDGAWVVGAMSGDERPERRARSFWTRVPVLRARLDTRS